MKLWPLLLVPALACCKADAPPPAATETAAPAGDTAGTAEPGRPPAQAEPVAISEMTDSYEFKYAYPAAAASVPELQAWLNRDRDQKRATLAKEAAAWKQEAGEAGFPFHRYSSLTEWKVVTETPDLLSLSAQIYTFSGGAHGMTVFDSVVWDKKGKATLDPVSLFRSTNALDDVARAAFCRELDRARLRKRGDVRLEGADNPFSACIEPVANSTVIVGSTDRKAIDRIGFLIPPYNAGPYAEGSYEVTLPVDAAMLNAVDPRYRGYFAVAR